MDIGGLFVKLGLDFSSFKKGIQDAKESVSGLSADLNNSFSSAGVTNYADTLSGLRLQVRTLGNEFKTLMASEGSLQDKTSALTQQIDTQRRVVELATQKYRETADAKGEMTKQTLLAQQKMSQEQSTLASLESQLRRLTQVEQENENQTKRSGDSFSSLGSIIKNSLVFGAVYTGINMVTGAIKGAITAGIDFDSNIQQNTIAFTQMLGSAQKAKAMLADLQQFAANTPFEMDQVESAAKQMLAFGFSAQQVKPYLTSIGDAASGLGLGADGINRIVLALGQMKAHGTADGNDLLQLMQAGIPVWDILSQKIGKSTVEVQNMVSKGLLPSGKAIDMLISGMETKFPHMMDAQSKSFAGMMSTLSDNTKQVLGQVMQPMFDTLANKVLPNFTNATSAFQQGFSNGGFIGGLNAVQSALIKAGQGSSIFSSALTGLRVIVYGLKGDFDSVDEILSNLGVPDSVLDGFDKFRAAIANDFQIVKGVVLDFVDKAKPIVMGMFQDIVSFWTQNGPEIMQAIQNIINFIVAAFKFIWPFIEPILLTIVDGVRKAGNLILDIVKLFADLFTGNWSGLWQTLKKLAVDGLGLLWDVIQVSGFGKLLKLFGDIGTGIINVVKNVAKDAVEWGKNIVEGLWNGIVGMKDWLLGKVTSWIKDVIPNPIKKLLNINSPSKLMQEYGQYVAQGLALGIDMNKDLVVKSATEMANAVSDIVSKIQVVQTQMFNEAQQVAPGMSQSQLNIIGLMNSNIGNSKLVNALANGKTAAGVNQMIQDVYNQMAAGSGKNVSSDVLYAQAQANVNAMLNGQKPSYMAGDIHVNINAPVYGVNDLNKAIQQQVVPALTKVLQQPARTMG